MASFDQIVELIADDLTAVEIKLTEQTASEYSFVDMAVQHVVEGGGKRLRPILVVLSAKVCGYEGSDAHTLAAVVELIHVASLVHDDVLDEAAIRRGRETLQTKWGQQSCCPRRRLSPRACPLYARRPPCRRPRNGDPCRHHAGNVRR